MTHGEPEPTAVESAPELRPDEQLNSLLSQLSEAAAEGLPADSAAHENRLVQVRLGIAASLFTSLQYKHSPTAAHCLRVAMGCSRWTMALELSEQQLDEIEVAALLHDIGKIGVPDQVISKPDKLCPLEVALMDGHRRMGIEILRGCCASQAVLDIVYYAPAWYDGRRTNFRLRGDELPLQARMMAIVDAFDSMTTDHDYRRAISRELALAELYQHAGTQFDPMLVKQFVELHDGDRSSLSRQVARRWLQQLDIETSDRRWLLGGATAHGNEPAAESIFHHKLLENMRDGVVFVDSNLQIQLWNRGAERLCGISCANVQQRAWSPGLVGLCDEKGAHISDADCPVGFVLRSGVQSIRRLMITNRRGRQVSCDVHIVPVIGQDGSTYGANVLLHDASPEASLEERCQSLHEKATRDPLTQVANRAEFDRAHKSFVQTHLERGLPCSLIICDIDHFKRINDTFGHQAGDEVIKTFAQWLKQMCRPGDLVARYGGEEFVLLCADCDNATAAQRAEQMRRTMTSMPLKAIGGQWITASFGVTEVQAGDTDETMLRRADRALLMAKEGGRNAIVQLGTGIGDHPEPAIAQRRWFWWRKRSDSDLLLERDLVTPVPIKVAVEKLRGFVADHAAILDAIEGNRVLLRIEAVGVPLLRRSSDRAVAFLLDLSFGEEQVKVQIAGGDRVAKKMQTRVRAAIRPKRQRDRRHDGALRQARHLLTSLRCYLMAVEADLKEDDNVVRRATSIVSAWLSD